MNSTFTSAVRTDNPVPEPGLLDLTQSTLKAAHELRDRANLIADTLGGSQPQAPQDGRVGPGMQYGGLAGCVAETRGALSNALDTISRIERLLGPARN